MSDEELNAILSLTEGDMLIGNLEGYDNIFVKFNSKKISIIPRNIGIFGTVGSGKTNTAQVLIEELANAEPKWAVIVLDIEGEYTMMNKPNNIQHEIDRLKHFGKSAEGLKDFHVLKLCNSESAIPTAEEVTIRIDQIDPYVLAEILNTTEPQTAALLGIIDELKGKSKDLKKGKTKDLKDEFLEEDYDVLTRGKRRKAGIVLIILLMQLINTKQTQENLV